MRQCSFEWPVNQKFKYIGLIFTLDELDWLLKLTIYLIRWLNFFLNWKNVQILQTGQETIFLTPKKHWIFMSSFIFALIIFNGKGIVGCFIYILDSSNSSSFTFWSSKLASSSRSNWTGICTGNSNGSWTDKQSSHFSTAKEMSVKPTFFFM